jgi:dihydroxyacetone kinase
MSCGSEQIREVLKILAQIMEENRDMLTGLDSAMGDGDLGIYMAKGFLAASEVVVETEAVPGELLIADGRSFSETAPSTLGTLIGMAMIRAGKVSVNRSELSDAELTAALRAACDEIVKRGKAKQGEKTILDSVCPAVEAMEKSLAVGQNGKAIFEAAITGEEKSRTFAAVHGRPAYFGDKAIGMKDGGAVVGVLIFQGICKVQQ